MSGGEATVRKSTIIGILGAAAVLALTGCSPNYEQASEQKPAAGTPPPASAIAPAETPAEGAETANVNTDLEFAQQMVAHHRAEQQLLEVALNNASRQNVTDLAEQLEQQHGENVEQLESWLSEHGEGEVTAEDLEAGQNSQMPSADVSGEVTELEEAQRGQFPGLWVKAMIEHHESVVEMTETELDQGSDEQVKSIAQRILDSRQEELDELKQLREQL
ncbi:uncharacterized protein (DUF305 family) [Actinopolyspora biskrensis]|uniref:Uncharacterized protein (DUF305 family) n=1 Tax=Actinopolyspora biskrensis TaxID=1470178 RepID=A0A852ZD88_9ACTN|nr:DUF305 domain-containing protein [Actinopolyspora biskrensis]NYH79963.1 uncharacterized protein (DUF305 family) [Actinopolyspora biskrensis]